MNDLDDLMSRIDEINHKSPTSLTHADIDDIIKYHRQARARKASGEKPKRTKATQSIDNLLSSIIPAQPATNIKRRF